MFKSNSEWAEKMSREEYEGALENVAGLREAARDLRRVGAEARAVELDALVVEFEHYLKKAAPRFQEVA